MSLIPFSIRSLGISTARFSEGRSYFREALSVDRLNQHEEAQTRYLVRLLDHCRLHVPYYAELMREAPIDWRANPRGYLRTLPILTKNIIRSRFENLKSDDLKNRVWTFNTSGGSTGEPVRLIQDRQYFRYIAALVDMQHLWLNHRPGDPIALLWGSERDILGGRASWRDRVLSALYDQTTLNAFLMTRERMREFVRVINDMQPTLLLAYAQAIYELAGFIEEENLDVKPPGAILTSAGTLHDFMRERIKRVFRCQVANRYGSREVSAIASQCSQDGSLHVPPTGVYVEVVDDAGEPVSAGTEGNILVTGLANLAMPMVRYFIADRGILSSKERCVCGRGGQMLERVLGRTVDAFCLADGTLIDGEYFTHLLYYRTWVRKFQVVQKAYDHIEYRIAGTRPLDTEVNELVEKTRAVMGSACRVTFDFVSEIREGSSGKYRYTISEVPRINGVHSA